MAYFTDAADVYSYVGRLIEELLGDASVAERFAAVDAVVEFRFHDPDATVTMDLRGASDVAVIFGATDLEAQIVLTMDADIAHLMWLGELDVTIALARGQISATGPVEQLLAVMTAGEPAAPRYRALLIAQGRKDLLAASDVDHRAPRTAAVAS